MKLRRAVRAYAASAIALLCVMGASGRAAWAGAAAPKPLAPPSQPAPKPPTPLQSPGTSPSPIQPAGGTCNPERFVAQVYRDLLRRSVDEVNLQSWVSQLRMGGTRTGVVQMIMNSTEYRARQVESLYSALLGRQPDRGGVSTYVGMLQQGGTTEQVEVAILSSGEYFQRRGGGTTDGFLKALYKDALDRPIDEGSAARFREMLAGGGTRAGVAEEVAGSADARQRRTRILYGDFLRRLSSSGPAGGGGQGEDQTIANILGSDEYCARI